MERNEIRCGNCGKLLGKGTALDFEIKCPRCKAINHLRASEQPLLRDSRRPVGAQSCPKTLVRRSPAGWAANPFFPGALPECCRSINATASHLPARPVMFRKQGIEGRSSERHQPGIVTFYRVVRHHLEEFCPLFQMGSCFP